MTPGDRVHLDDLYGGRPTVVEYRGQAGGGYVTVIGANGYQFEVLAAWVSPIPEVAEQAGPPEGTHDHPVPARCDTCAFCSYDGEYGGVRTCDADVECEPEEEAAVAQAVDEWVGAGEVGPCPAWKSSQWNEPSAWDEFVAYCASTGVNDEPDQTLPPECP